MIGGIPLKMCGYKTRAVINRVRLITALVRYIKDIKKSLLADDFHIFLSRALLRGSKYYYGEGYLQNPF